MIIEINAAIFFQSLILILLCVYLVFLKLNKRYETQQRQIKSLSNDLQALLLCARGVGEKLHHQEDEVRFIQERQEKIELHDSGKTLPPYKHIMALMGQGANQNDMMNSCDLTKGEVELMQSLQKNISQAQATH